MGCGDWRFRFFGTLATFLCHNPLPIPIPIFRFLEKNFRAKKLSEKNFVNFIHFCLKLYVSGTFERGKIWGWYCIFGILGGHIYLVYRPYPYLISPWGQGWDKKAIFWEKIPFIFGKSRQVRGVRTPIAPISGAALVDAPK